VGNDTHSHITPWVANVSMLKIYGGGASLRTFHLMSGLQRLVRTGQRGRTQGDA